MIAAFFWLFEDRQTGRIVIGQKPNVPLMIFAGAWLADAVLRPRGPVGVALRAAEVGSLAAWAADEAVRGVNPWRKALGAVGLLYAAQLLTRR